MTSRKSDGSELATTGSLDTVDGLAQLSFLIYGVLERRASEHDLSIVQTRLLGILRDREPGMHELSQLLDLDKSSVTGLVDRAARRGLVKRVPSTTDRRAVRVKLTSTGRALVRQVASRFEADVTVLLDCLTPRDQQVMTAFVSRVLVAHALEHGVDLFDVAR